MSTYPKADYSLRYDKHGVETEINQISPLLTAPEYSIDEVEERLKPKFPIIREAVRIARRYKYDMDIHAKCAIHVTVYHDFHECLGLTDLMQLFGRADLVGIDKVNLGRAVKIEAFFLIEGKDSETESRA